MTASILTSPSASVNVSAQGGLLKIKVPSGLQVGGGKRGNVLQEGISRQSRKRMIEKFCSLQLDYKKPPIFITLTYPDLDAPFGEENRHLRAFKERLRRAFPESSAMWRKEAENRKSGIYLGSRIPHFHLVVINAEGLDYKTVKRWWSEIIDTDNKNLQVKVITCKNRKHVFAYISKYVAKMGKPEAEQSIGPEPARPHVFEEDVAGEATLTIAHKCTHGRWWGVFNSKFLPFGVYVESIVELPEHIFYAYRRDARRAFAGVGKIYTKNEDGSVTASEKRIPGFTLFVDNPYQWMALLGHYFQTL